MNLLPSFRKELRNKNINNGMWLYGLQIFNTIIPLLTLPYVTRILEASQYGVFSIALNIVGYLQVCIEYGFGMSATRETALIGNDKKKLSLIFSSVLFARLFLFFLSFLFVVVYIGLNDFNRVHSYSLLILLSGLVGICFQQNWLFQGLQEMKYISIINIVSRIVSVVSIFVFVKDRNDLLLYCFFYSISPVLSGFLSFFIAKVKFGMIIVLVSKQRIFLELKKGWYVFTTSLSSKVFGAIGITFLGMMADNSIVGVYSAIQKIPVLMMFMWTPISQIIFPIVSKRMELSFIVGERFVRDLRRKILPFFILMSIVVGLFSKNIVFIAFGPNYSSYYYWILPLLFWIILSINNNFLGIQILLASGHDKEYGISFQFGVVVTIISNLLLVKFYGGNGASVAPAISEFILSLMLVFQINKIKRKYSD